MCIIMKKTALLLVVSLMACVVLFAPHAAFAETGYWENVLTFENGENSDISWNYTPSSAAAAAGRVGTATIVDDGTGNQALKVVSKITEAEQRNNPSSGVGDSGDMLTFNLPNFGQLTGVIEITGEVRVDSANSRPFWRFADLGGASANCSWRSYSNYLARTGTVASFIPYNKTGYTKFRYVIDLNETSDNFYMYAPGASQPGHTGSYTGPTTETIPLSFMTYYQQAGQAWIAPSAGVEGIYWIDNIKVSGYRAAVTGTVPSQNATDIEALDDIKLTLNDSVQNFDQSKVSLSVNGVKTEQFDAELSNDGTVITVTPENGLQYNKQYELALTAGYAQKINQSYQNPAEYKLSFKTKSIIPPITNWKESAIFAQGFAPEMSVVDGVSRVVTLAKDGGEALNYTEGTQINDMGAYVMVITATDAVTGKTQTESYSFQVVMPTAPLALDVTIDGKAETNETLEGFYTYEDYNNDEQGVSMFRWLRATTENGEYKPITNATAKTYTLQTADEGMWLKFEVTPVAVVEPKTGTPVQSEPFMGPMKPVASQVSVSEENGILTGSYTYSDANGDAVDTAALDFNWYFQNIETGAVTKIDNADSLTYTLGQNDINTYIIFGVTPVSTKKPYQGDEVRTEPYLLPCAPHAQNVSISGTAAVGKTLSAYYTFYDANGDTESGTVCNWYVNGQYRSTGASLDVVSGMEGAMVYFEITPGANAFPANGATVTSGTVTVSASSGAIVQRPVIGGVGGGSSKPNGSGPSTVIPPTDTNNETATGFVDAGNHWAKNEINIMREKGIINGVTETEFRPDGVVKRGEVAKLIAKVFDLTSSAPSVFADVTENDWFTEYVDAVAEHGFMRGDGDQFRPENAMTREEICMILATVAEKYNVSAEENAIVFSDENEISDWAKEAVELAVGTGFMNGMGDGEFAPKQQVTRAQITVILCRVMERLSI